MTEDPIACIHRVLDLVNADLRATRPDWSPITLASWEHMLGFSVGPGGPIARTFYVVPSALQADLEEWEHGDPGGGTIHPEVELVDEIQAEIAEYSHWEELEIWPVCRTHGLALRADRRDGHTIWLCKSPPGHIVAGLGELTAAEAR
jgi:hypothetical protein